MAARFLTLEKLQEHFGGKTVLITGHTGFKGSWLAEILRASGADVRGFSLVTTSRVSHHQMLTNETAVLEVGDVRNFEEISLKISEIEPDYVFHLAAQPLVKRSLVNPIETWQTNVMGTIHLMEALRVNNRPVKAVMVTSDKVYENREWAWPYRETDSLGGKDPYSSSKAAAELGISSYSRSYFPNSGNVRIAVVRAGNVIGGGDWSESRLVPDLVKSWSEGREVEIRQPKSTRPWQHVLEPLSGYLKLATKIDTLPIGETFNFGPKGQGVSTVQEVVERSASLWGAGANYRILEAGSDSSEAGLLSLASEKALQVLEWEPRLNQDEGLDWTIEWYKSYYNSGPDAATAKTREQIQDFFRRT